MKKVILYEDAIVNPSNKFNEHVRSINMEEPLDRGDIISIPSEYVVYGICINGAKDDAGNPILTHFIYVNVRNIFTGSEKNVRFFPNQLAKIVYPVDKEGKRLLKVRTKGTASAYYCTFKNVDDAMENLKGRKIEIKDKIEYRTERYGDRQIVTTYIFEYDFCDRYLVSKTDTPYLKFNDNKTSVIGVHDNSIVKAYIPDDVYEIDEFAFGNCENLRTLYLNKIRKIKKYAFRNCSSLRRIDIPKTTSYIDIEAFEGCSALTEIHVQAEKYYMPKEEYECDMPVKGYCSVDGILYIQYQDLRIHTLSLRLVPQNHHQVHLVLPDNVVKIYHEAFKECKKIQSVTLPSNLEECPYNVFAECESLRSIFVPKHTISKFSNLIPNYKHLLVEMD